MVIPGSKIPSHLQRSREEVCSKGKRICGTLEKVHEQDGLLILLSPYLQPITSSSLTQIDTYFSIIAELVSYFNC